MSDAGGMVTNLVSTVIALVVVLGLAWVSLRALKRLQDGRAAKSAGAHDVPQVLRSVGLGPRERLVTVRYRGREFLLGVTAGAITVVDSHAVHAVQAGSVDEPSPPPQDPSADSWGAP